MYCENCIGLENEVKIYNEKLDICNKELIVIKKELVELKKINDILYSDKVKFEKFLFDLRMKLSNFEGELKDLKVENFYFKLCI